MFIYLITNKISGKRYVGQTCTSINQRFKEHCEGGAALHAAIKKYGRQNFSVEELGHYDSREDLNIAEAYFVEWYNCVAPNGYNLTSGGENNYFRSEQTKAKVSKTKAGVPNPKVSAALKGRRLSPRTEFKKGQTKDQTGAKNHMFGKPAHNRGKPHSQNTRINISNALKGKRLGIKFSEEHKRNLSSSIKAAYAAKKAVA